MPGLNPHDFQTFHQLPADDHPAAAAAAVHDAAHHASLAADAVPAPQADSLGAAGTTFPDAAAAVPSLLFAAAVPDAEIYEVYHHAFACPVSVGRPASYSAAAAVAAALQIA